MLTKTKIKIALAVVLIGIITAGGYRYESAIRTTAYQAYQIAQQLQQLEQMSNQMQEIKQMQEMNKQLMEEYIKSIRETTSEYKELQENINKMISEHEQAREWSIQRVPDPILRAFPPDMREIINQDYPNE